MKVGDLAYDVAVKQVVLIVNKDVEWEDIFENSTQHWDFEVLSDDIGLYYVDADELRKVIHEKQEK